MCDDCYNVGPPTPGVCWDCWDTRHPGEPRPETFVWPCREHRKPPDFSAFVVGDVVAVEAKLARVVALARAVLPGHQIAGDAEGYYCIPRCRRCALEREHAAAIEDLNAHPG